MTEDLHPAYLAFIRRELNLPPGSDALVELTARLQPADPAAKPPYRAPAIVRLRRALRRLEQHNQPTSTLEQFAQDLRFLRMFAVDEPILPEDAMRTLLSDVMASPPIRKPTAKPPAQSQDEKKVVAFRRKSQGERT